MIDHVLGRPSVQFRKIQVLAVVSFWSFYLYRQASQPYLPPIMLTIRQRRPPRPPNPPPHIEPSFEQTHHVADGRHNPSLPLRRTQLRQARRSRMPRTARKPLLTVVLPRHMGHYRLRRGVLVRHEDQEKGDQGFHEHGVHGILHDMRRTGG